MKSTKKKKVTGPKTKKAKQPQLTPSTSPGIPMYACGGKTKRKMKK